jgi:hypothetical protein
MVTRAHEPCVGVKVKWKTLALELARLDELQEVFYARALDSAAQFGALVAKIIERRCVMLGCRARLGLLTPQTNV